MAELGRKRRERREALEAEKGALELKIQALRDELRVVAIKAGAL